MTFCGGYTNDRPHSTYFFHMVSKKSETSFTAVIKSPATTKPKKRKNSPPPRVENSSRRSREYLTPAEVKDLRAGAKNASERHSYYRTSNSSSRKEALNDAKAATNAVWSDNGVIVSETVGITWNGLREHSKRRYA